MSMSKQVGVTALVGLAVLLGALSAVWACTGQPQVFSVSPLTAPVGAEVTMRGEAVAVGTPVELRWNGVAGPKLAEVTAGADASFALSFTVPEAEPGVYSLVVVTGEDGAVAVGRTAFAVSGAAAAAVADSGFASATQAAGLDTPVGVGSSAALMAGMGLLAVGGVALFAGFAVATVRRRRASAVPSGSLR